MTSASILFNSLGLALSCFADPEHSTSIVGSHSNSCRDIVNTMDLMVDNKLSAYFAELHIPYCSEERNYMPSLFTNYEYWVLADPLDGSLNFSSSLPDYGVSLTLLSKRKPIASAIGHPTYGLSIFASNDSSPKHSRNLVSQSTGHIQPMAIAHGSTLSQEEYCQLFSTLCSIGSEAFPGFHRLGSAVSCMVKFLVHSYSSVLLYDCKICDLLAGVHISLLTPGVSVYANPSLSVVYLVRPNDYSTTLLLHLQDLHPELAPLFDLSI